MVPGPDEHNNDMVKSDERVTACGDGTFCCGNGAAAKDCCSEGKGARLVDGLTTLKDLRRATTSHSVTRYISSPSTSTRSAITTTRSPSRALYPSSTTLPLQSSPSPSPSPSSFGVGPLVSVILGGVFLAFLLISAGVYIYRRRRKRKQLYAKQHSSLGDSIVILDVEGPTPQRGSAPTEATEMQESIRGNGKREEIDGRVRPPELAAGLAEKVVWVDRRKNAVMHMGF
ncbi:MAG: hypothetical protein Q9208_006565 [Pyrenodesmia sp. 3 TL-2023]